MEILSLSVNSFLSFVISHLSQTYDDLGFMCIGIKKRTSNNFANPFNYLSPVRFL